MRIIIVGASRGIGKFISDNLKDHDIIRVSRTINKKEGIKADVTNHKDMILCAKRINKKWDYADCLIYCAGTIGKVGPAMNMDMSSWAETININLNGFFNSMKVFFNLLNKAKHPKVIAFSGGGSTKGRPGFSSYASSKAGLVRLVETLAGELPSFNINAIAPGSILTNMTKEVIKAGPKTVGEKEYEDALKTNRVPNDALKLIKFLISPKGNRVSGRLIAAIWDNWKDPDCYKGEAGFLRRIEPKQ